MSGSEELSSFILSMDLNFKREKKKISPVQVLWFIICYMLLEFYTEKNERNTAFKDIIWENIAK